MSSAATVYDPTGQAGFLPSDASGSDSSGTGAVTDSGSNTSLAGLTGIFSAVGSAFSDAYRTVNPTITAQKPGTLVYNPATGGYQSASAIQTAGTTSAYVPLLMLAAGALVIYLILKR